MCLPVRDAKQSIQRCLLLIEPTEGPFPSSKQAAVLQARLVYQSLAAAAAGAGEVELLLCQELLDCVTLGLSSPLRRFAAWFEKDGREESSE